MKNASDYMVYTFTMTREQAKQIEHLHDDRETLQWMPELSDDEFFQSFKVAGEPEIVLELAANLEFDNVNKICYPAFPNWPY